MLSMFSYAFWPSVFFLWRTVHLDLLSSFFFFFCGPFYFFNFFYLQWILSYIKMKQPWVYMCSPSRSPLQPPSPPAPSRSSQCTRSERLSHTSNLLSSFWLGCYYETQLHELLYILEVNPLSFALFPNIFSQSVDCVFMLLMVPFAVQKLLSWIGSHLLIYIFIFITLGGGSEKDIAIIYVKECSAHVFLQGFYGIQPYI